MYANRFGTERRVNPGSLGVAIGLNGAVVAALLLAAPPAFLAKPPKILETYIVPDTPPPPELPPPPQPELRKAQPRIEHIVAPRREVETTQPTDNRIDTTLTPPPPDGTPSGTGTATGTTTIEPPPPPLFVAPSVDPRYAADFQPVYPAEERRAGREGKVTVRVLIGVDGRVKDIQPITVTSDAFFRVTADRARSRWRFKPATRGGIPVEAWRTMNLNFVLQD